MLNIPKKIKVVRESSRPPPDELRGEDIFSGFVPPPEQNPPLYVQGHRGKQNFTQGAGQTGDRGDRISDDLDFFFIFSIRLNIFRRNWQ